MSEGQLFDTPEQLSPRLAWLKEHHLRTEQQGDDWWKAWQEITEPRTWTTRKSFTFIGTTEDEALLKLAIGYKIRLWNEQCT